MVTACERQADEKRLYMKLLEAQEDATGDKKRQEFVWVEHWPTVYALAQAGMRRVMREF